jgi:hypothetical protein
MVDAAVTVGVDAVTLTTTMGMDNPMQVHGTLAAIFDRHRMPISVCTSTTPTE